MFIHRLRGVRRIHSLQEENRIFTTCDNWSGASVSGTISIRASTGADVTQDGEHSLNVMISGCYYGGVNGYNCRGYAQIKTI